MTISSGKESENYSDVKNQGDNLEDIVEPEFYFLQDFELHIFDDDNDSRWPYDYEIPLAILFNSSPDNIYGNKIQNQIELIILLDKSVFHNL